MRVARRTVLGGALAAGAASTVPLPAAASSRRLTNLDHLDYLRTTVTPPAQVGHSTYGPGPLGVLWTYADRQPDGSYKRIGGGTYDPVTDTYGQGAFNADDISRAAVVYLRAGRLSVARDLLRGLTYLQSPNGNVVLWMQPDGTLNPSAEPVELPDPSDSGPSYWLARTVWALGEGYAAFRQVDRRFAEFLRDRLELALAALERQVLVRYGQWNVVDGRRVPAWLIVNGADATSEAVLGLAAYVGAGGSARARRALAQFAEGIAAMSAGTSRSWPFRALLPWAESIAVWHAWGAQMPSALAAASSVLRTSIGPAIEDTAGFTPLLMTAGGPDNGWLPAPIDRTQIAYGVDARLQGLLAVGLPGLKQLAAFVAAWYFGANRAGQAMYDATSGRTYDGISGDGVINRNSGAESTIHGLLSMLALDARPRLARLAQELAGAVTPAGLQVVEGESATGGQVVTPPSAWTGESQWSSGAYVALSAGSTAEWTVPASAQPRLVLPVVNLLGPGRTTWSGGGRTLGTIDHAAPGPQGISAAPGVLQPITLGTPLPPYATRIKAEATAGTAQIDALLLIPSISTLSAGNAVLLSSVDARARTYPVRTGTVAYSYTANGVLHSRRRLTGGTSHVLVQPGGFTIVL
ncbi:hypothetical protein E1218_11590 [Kribbella turkmenica]|uniref:Uncharacterized protein n=1 Tax=Kribbella turkmenica TaxID=2530375 RepID=A0A4R4X8Z4_9ACTN|nr:hypothetical protein [Kribbella turkmenica]TDD26973.1 hypothetical protein E1218_11590 [Kribbella turkmenica]